MARTLKKPKKLMNPKRGAGSEKRLQRMRPNTIPSGRKVPASLRTTTDGHQGAEKMVAGRPEPRRQTFLFRAYGAFRRRAGKAWHWGFALYLSLVAPFKRAFLGCARFSFSQVARASQRVGGCASSWRSRTAGILRWTGSSCGRIVAWRNTIRDDMMEIIHARQAGKSADMEALKSMRGPSCLVWLLASLTGITGGIWLLIRIAVFLRNLWGGGVAVAIMIPVGLLLIPIAISLLSRATLLVLPLLCIPPVLVVGVVGLAIVALVAVVYLAILVLLLMAVVLIALVAVAAVALVLAVFAVAATVLFVPIVALSAGLALYLIGLILLQSLLLLVITLLRPGQYLWVAWRGIKYVCPSGECTSFKVPAHVCPECGAAYSKLWPSRYGVWRHICAGSGGTCARSLPTLETFGRGELARVCAECGGQFVSRRHGKWPVALLAIAGGQSVGKTTMMVMAANELATATGNPHAGIRGGVETQEQQKNLESQLKRLRSGSVLVPTTGGAQDALILWMQHEKRPSLVYAYDAPGELFSGIDSFSRLQYIEHSAGIVLLVDPASLEQFRSEAGPLDPADHASETPLGHVVASCVAAAAKVIDKDREGRMPVRVAVVITKGDLEGVRQRLPHVVEKGADSPTCRNALMTWGAHQEIRTLENEFSSVEYFACSALGRTPTAGDETLFQPWGVLDPFLWALSVSDRRAVNAVSA